jgi:hypothetical protein
VLDDIYSYIIIFMIIYNTKRMYCAYVKLVTNSVPVVDPYITTQKLSSAEELCFIKLVSRDYNRFEKSVT